MIGLPPDRFAASRPIGIDREPISLDKVWRLRASPIYAATAKNGHFGNPNFPWERTTEAEALKG